jgi:hypothetical protein
VIRDGLINEIRVRFAQQSRLYKNVLRSTPDGAHLRGGDKP